MTKTNRRVADGAMQRRLLLSVTTALTALVIGAGPLLAQNWRDLGPKERYDALQNYRRYQQLPEERQQDVERRYEHWRTMSPNEQDRVRQTYERFRQMPPRDRERIERKYEKWKQQAVPPP